MVVCRRCCSLRCVGLIVVAIAIAATETAIFSWPLVAAVVGLTLYLKITLSLPSRRRMTSASDEWRIAVVMNVRISLRERYRGLEAMKLSS